MPWARAHAASPSPDFPAAPRHQRASCSFKIFDLPCVYVLRNERRLHTASRRVIPVSLMAHAATYNLSLGGIR